MFFSILAKMEIPSDMIFSMLPKRRNWCNGCCGNATIKHGQLALNEGGENFVSYDLTHFSVSRSSRMPTPCSAPRQICDMPLEDLASKCEAAIGGTADLLDLALVRVLPEQLLVR